MHSHTELLTALKGAAISAAQGVDLSTRCAIRASGTASLLIVPRNEAELVESVRILRAAQAPYKVIGRLSNLMLVSDPVVTPIISTEKLTAKRIEEDLAYAEAGCSLPSLGAQLTRRGWEGFWGLVTVPGSVGGGVFMNAGAYGHEVSDFLVSVRCIDPMGKIVEVTKVELEFAYRSSAFKDKLNGHAIIGASFFRKAGDAVALEKKMVDAKAHRMSYLENESPNLGSTLMAKDIYAELGNKFPGFKLTTVAVKAMLRVLPRSRRDSAWATIMTPLARTYFRVPNGGKVGVSPRTYNCVVNNGGASTHEIAVFVKQYHSAIDRCIPLEIELFEDPETIAAPTGTEADRQQTCTES